MHCYIRGSVYYTYYRETRSIIMNGTRTIVYVYISRKTIKWKHVEGTSGCGPVNTSLACFKSQEYVVVGTGFLKWLPIQFKVCSRANSSGGNFIAKGRTLFTVKDPDPFPKGLAISIRTYYFLRSETDSEYTLLGHLHLLNRTKCISKGCSHFYRLHYTCYVDILCC